MFECFRRRRGVTWSEPRQKNTNGHACFVFWPNGERESFLVDPSRLDNAALANARKLLEILSLTGTLVRGSVATGRLQTLTSAIAAPPRRPLAVRISGADDEPMASVAVFGSHHDPAGVKSALSLVADDAHLAVEDSKALGSASGAQCGIVVAAFGPKHDAAVDEAYGMALHLGAAMNEVKLPHHDQTGEA